jgi:hypothetical protein
LILLGDFFYYYFKSISRGLPMELPTTYSHDSSQIVTIR